LIARAGVWTCKAIIDSSAYSIRSTGFAISALYLLLPDIDPSDNFPVSPGEIESSVVRVLVRLLASDPFALCLSLSRLAFSFR
jgi:hypothetical protein